jgi:hypothetical protein
MSELYSLHTPYVVGLLAFVVVFIWSHRKPEGR